MSLGDDLAELQTQLRTGALQRSYGAIISYMSQLRARFATRDGDRAVSALYQGSFDMTYFALFPPALKSRGLKLAIVFDYTSFAFEVWLAARNRALQRRYWQLLRDSGWAGYRLVEPAVGVDAIVERDVAAASALVVPDELTSRIEAAAQALSNELAVFLEANDSETAVQQANQADSPKRRG
jgi:hypothetical protein